MNYSTHIIEKVFLEVNTSNKETAYSIKNNINLFLKDELFPRLELLFDEYDIKETSLRFNNLNINVSVDNWNNYKEIKYEILNQFEKKLERHIQQNAKTGKIERTNSDIDKSNVQKISSSKNFNSTFIFFLKNGYLPWFGTEQQFIKFTTPENWSNSLDEPSFVEKLQELAIKDTAAINRFIYQFSNETIFAFLIKINPKLEEFKKQLSIVTVNTESKIRYFFLNLLFQICISSEIDSIVNSLQVFFQEIKNHKIASYHKSELENILKIVKLISKLLPEKAISNFPFQKDSNINGKEDTRIQKNNIDNKTTKIRSKKDENKKVATDSMLFEIAKISNAENIDEKDIVSFLSIVGKPFGLGTLRKENKLIQHEKELSFFEKGSKDIAIENAGLILLHPFLKYFFIETEIADKNGNLIKGKLDLAIQSLHFIATGKENVFEGNLVFEKFICGVPIKTPIRKQSLLTDKIRNEASVLLKGVIKNWPALKNTSPDGLRQMFINRDGKLIQKEDKFKLIIERKVQDILLEKLNWNILIVKLPWKKELIIVEW